jgi:hypothetical protein
MWYCCELLLLKTTALATGTNCTEILVGEKPVAGEAPAHKQSPG